ncbi:MAG TPA: carboxypeptidase-like regulatory domain-containing protein, partial [Candidatus Nitrosotenuis sp.]|nr:carboxypeptidase-like regulatory domain-containing protein [Candidatus Nitrosotenuis sp.]
NNAHWLAWRQAREIINLGSTTAKVRGQVTRENGMFLSNVSFTIYEAGTDSVVKQVITDAEGKFSASQLPAGNFDFRWELEGYMTVNETNLQIAAGKELKRKIVMEEGGGSATLTGDVAAGAIANINVVGIEVREETTIRLKVTGSTLRFYAATGNMEPPGTQYLDVLPGQIIQKTVIQFASMVGFDEELEDFLNVQNNGAVQGHWEMRFENLGS